MAQSILVIDDEPALRLLAEALLEELGYSALLAENGQAAVRLLLADPDGPAAALLDMTMPGLSPAETFRHLREISPTLPIIILSGQSEESVRLQFGSGTIAGYLQKPYDEVELEAALARALARDNFQSSSPFKLQPLSDSDKEELAREYLAARKLEFPRLAGLLATADFEQLRIIGHTLKGSGGCFGFVELTQLGSALEHFAQVSDAVSCAEQLARLEGCLATLDPHLS